MDVLDLLAIGGYFNSETSWNIYSPLANAGPAKEIINTTTRFRQLIPESHTAVSAGASV